MLPSLGYFKGENCPFYANGLCERPYCHFRHIKKDSQELNDNISDGEILQQLISEAVKKVLMHAEGGATVKLAANDIRLCESIPGKVTYNPTPIAELNKLKESEDKTATLAEKNDEFAEVFATKRHIPVPYTPHRPSKIQRKRPNSDDQTEKLTHIDVSSIKAYTPTISSSVSGLTYSPNSVKDICPVPYQPEGSTSVNGTYLPGSNPVANLQIYTPVGPSGITNSNYVPTNKSALEKLVNIDSVYEPVGQSKSSVKYEPGSAPISDHVYTPVSSISYEKTKMSYEPTKLAKPKYPCFSSDEDELIPKKNDNDEINERNSLEDLDYEFDIIGQILEAENGDEDKKILGLKQNKSSIKEKTRKNQDKRSTESCIKESKSKDKDKNKTDKRRKSSSRNLPNKSEDIRTSVSKRPNDKKSQSQSSHKSSKLSTHKDKSKDSGFHKKHSSESSHKSGKSSSSKKKSDHKTSSSESRSNKSKEVKKSSSGYSKSKSKLTQEKPESKNTEKSQKNNNTSETVMKSDDDYSFDEDILTALSDTDPEDVDEECLKIFEEYIPIQKQEIDEEAITKNDKNDDIFVGKKRVSHVSAPVKITKLIAKPDYKVKAALAMAERFAKVKEQRISKQLENVKEQRNEMQTPVLHTPIPSQQESKSVTIPKGSLKRRIAHVPNVSTLLSAKKTIRTSSVEDSQPSTSTTVQTVAKGTSRTAHVPNDKFADRPGVLEPLGSKIAANIRSKFLHVMIDECLKIYMVPVDAYARAQQEELATSKKCNTISIYRNSALMTVSRLRKELQDAGGVKKGPESEDKISHNKVLVGKLDHVSWSIETKHKKGHDFSSEFKGLKFYNNVIKWVLTEQELQENGFPRPHTSGDRGRAMMYIANTKQKPPKGNLRCCSRCKKDFMVDKKGFALRKEECIYHPNKKYKFRGESKYQCCGQDGVSDGCASALCHVYEYVDYENLRGFVQTLPKEQDEYTDPGVYALDCEMCYTTNGLDLTRVTVIDCNCKVVYETFVRPLYPIIDYNTRYSGITEDQMRNVKTTLLEVQATLLHMFSSSTILVGHSLESDFKALKLIHDTVIDTSVLYPHKMGPPFKRALRNLTSEYLKKIIQNSVEGHDSAEDATVCMELIQFKLKEELKLR